MGNCRMMMRLADWVEGHFVYGKVEASECDGEKGVATELKRGIVMSGFGSRNRFAYFTDIRTCGILIRTTRRNVGLMFTLVFLVRVMDAHAQTRSHIS